jgi:hypothetical protein
MHIFMDICPFLLNLSFDTWSKRSLQSNLLIKCNMCFSCPLLLIKMDIPFGECGHFNEVGLLKSCDFL